MFIIDFFIIGVGFVGVFLVCFFVLYGKKGFLFVLVLGILFIFCVYIINFVGFEIF